MYVEKIPWTLEHELQHDENSQWSLKFQIAVILEYDVNFKAPPGEKIKKPIKIITKSRKATVIFKLDYSNSKIKTYVEMI